MDLEITLKGIKLEKTRRIFETPGHSKTESPKNSKIEGTTRNSVRLDSKIHFEILYIYMGSQRSGWNESIKVSKMPKLHLTGLS
jgi:hypothetical protein